MKSISIFQSKSKFLILFVLFSFSSSFNAQIPISDGFDYPIGDSYDANGYPIELLEGITPECNDSYPLYPNDATRGATGTGWHNVSDVGNFVYISNDPGVTDGIHPGEDWNFNSGCEDAGKEVYAVSNGIIESITPTWSSYSTGGWTIIIRHELPIGTIYIVFILT